MGIVGRDWTPSSRLLCVAPISHITVAKARSLLRLKPCHCGRYLRSLLESGRELFATSALGVVTTSAGSTKLASVATFTSVAFNFSDVATVVDVVVGASISCVASFNVTSEDCSPRTSGVSDCSVPGVASCVITRGSAIVRSGTTVLHSLHSCPNVGISLIAASDCFSANIEISEDE